MVGTSKTSGSFTLQDEDTGEKANVALKVDGTTQGLHVISESNIEDKDGKHLLAGDAYAINIEYVMNDSQTVDHSFKSPNTSTRIHLKFKTYSAGRTEIQLFEAPTGVVYDFSWSSKNRNRESSNTAEAVVQSIDSLTTPGTYIWKESNYGSGLSVNQSPPHFSQEIILKQNTEYLFRVISHDPSNLTTVQVQWYEV
jgi:hypothetical protein